MSDHHIGTVVIGGSQAGLAVGYHLRKRGLPLVILDEHERIGDAWLAPQHKTWLSGPDTGREPTRAGSHLDHLIAPLMWFVATRLTVEPELGRKLRDHFIDPPRGIPLGRVRRVARIVSTRLRNG